MARNALKGDICFIPDPPHINVNLSVNFQYTIFEYNYTNIAPAKARKIGTYYWKGVDSRGGRRMVGTGWLGRQMWGLR